MSFEHISQLRVKLENSNWVIFEELAGDEYSISAIWLIGRPNGNNMLNVIFEGLDDSSVLPLEKSYGCHIQENKDLSLYFHKINKGFTSKVADFVKLLSEMYT
ncbi:hypothetical protein H4J57_19205 [Colwellia sp. BRX8-7]|jgi:hypothetical protein|uniref:hypothetical protein n=1 Tax=Colwellia sp. BRX8-7 TaxID=2759833 RepID=UPI0015F5A294|nr:hypothetical protein [Colwellia sp. BRX8-7]MBA6339317.1 hypothetical protein [Colwellia sp. BRX8-7]